MSKTEGRGSDKIESASDPRSICALHMALFMKLISPEQPNPYPMQILLVLCLLG